MVAIFLRVTATTAQPSLSLLPTAGYRWHRSALHVLVRLTKRLLAVMNRDYSIRGASRPATDATMRQQKRRTHCSARSCFGLSGSPVIRISLSQLSGHLLLYKQRSCHMLRWRRLGRVGESGLPVLVDLVQVGGQSWSFSSMLTCGARNRAISSGAGRHSTARERIADTTNGAEGSPRGRCMPQPDESR
jgi:hypothetical protein